jgi:thiol:disulfide interchange protein DsbD
MKKPLFIILLTGICLISGYSQVLDPVKWHFSSRKSGNNIHTLTFEATIEKGWHMYGLNIPEGGPVATSFNFSGTTGAEFLGPVKPTVKPEVQFDNTFEMDLELFDGKIRFTREVKIADQAQTEIEGYVEFMVCDDARCLPPKEVEFSFLLGETKRTSDNTQTAGDNKTPPAQIQPDQDAPRDEAEPDQDSARAETLAVPEPDPTAGQVAQPPAEDENQSLLSLFFLAFAAGFGALLTPCVYPIIPLTISFFMRETSRSKAIMNGLFFGLSIVFIYTLVGLIAGLARIDIARMVSSHWLPNVLFFIIFMLLAFSFFGMFEITLPGSLSNKIDQQADKGGLLGPFFMALATVVISFSCTGPIVGVVLGSALQGEVKEPVIGMLGFSLSFALPFTLLAVFPEFMKKLPKSGGWLNSVKVFFAFIMVASSMIFITNLRLDFVSRELVISILIVVFILLGMYLLGKIKFAHDSDLPYISVPRLFISTASFVFALWLFTGLFGAPLNLIDPFIPEGKSVFLPTSVTTPGHEGHKSATGIGNACTNSPKFADANLHLPLGLRGYFDYDEALTCARELDKPVLLDFAGHSCKNCKKMYQEVWSDPRVLSRLQQNFVVAVLYTDDRTTMPESEWVTSELDGKLKKTIGKKFNDLQITKFGSNALPLYAIVDPDGNILTTPRYYTYSSDIDNFIAFLDQGKKNFNTSRYE